METQKLLKKWFTPELIVIIRNKPEEAVLWGCKDTNHAGALGAHNICQMNVDPDSLGCYSRCANTTGS
jgi:hypothetical protein